jgi:hypothetical protein
MQCKITKFKPDSIKPGRISFIVGKRGCGKSTLLKDLLSRMSKDVDYAVAMCPTMESADMLRGCLPASSVYDKYSASKVDQVVAVASHYASIGKKKNILLCLDDCLYDRNVLKSPSIRQIFFNGRHLGITFVALAQYCMDISPDLRTQIDYLFVMKENIVSNRQKLWKYLFGCVQNFEDFSTIMDRCTQNYECLCLDNTLQGGTVQECVFWYKANSEIKDFKVGSEVFFKLDRQTKRKISDLKPQLPPEVSSSVPRAGRKPTLCVVKEQDTEEEEDNGSDMEENAR